MLDTNAIGVEQPLDSNAHLLLLEASHEGRLVVCVPELVLSEAVNAWAEHVLDAYRNLEKAESRVRQLTVELDERDEIDMRALRARKEDDLRHILVRSQVRMLPMPEVDHDLVARRALDRTQPFDARGKDGYRDTLIWEAVLELAAEGIDVVFVSNDLKAYGRNRSEPELSEFLAAEVGERAGRRDAVKLIRSVRQAVEDLLEPSDDAIRQFEELFADQDFAGELVDALSNDLAGERLDPRMAGAALGINVISAGVTVAMEFDQPAIRFGRFSEDGYARVDLDLTWLADVGFTVPIEDFTAAASITGVTNWSFGSDEGVAGGEALLALDVSCEVTVDRAHGRLVDARVLEVLAVNPSSG